MNILDRYGIKEVADVTFYHIDSSTGKPDYPVLFLDTLKVSTIEQTAETSDATGGKGNAKLISWDYGKEITVTLEDALFSAKSLAIMFGNGTVKTYTGGSAYLMKTETFLSESLGTSDVPSGDAPAADVGGWKHQYVGPDGKLYQKVNPKFYDANGTQVTKTAGTGTVAWEANQTYFCTFDIVVDGAVIDVSANSFPGTYYVTGDTYVRSEKGGNDEFFQFIIPKAKVQSENTITLEAEGDPSTFNMSLTVLRPVDGVMMKLVKYDGANPEDPAAESSTAEIIHNHTLNPETVSGEG